MSNAHGLTKENLLFTFPAGLRENPSIAALGDVTMEALAKRPAEIAPLSIYPRIDELPEVLLDILAYDFKVDWWDRNYSIEEKRRLCPHMLVNVPAPFQRPALQIGRAHV